MTAAHGRVTLTGAACTTCHDPHSTRQAGSRLVMPDLHAPYKDKDCDVCHDASGKTASSVDVCADCHENANGFQRAHTAGRTGEAASQVAVCLDCHSPHAGYGKLLIRSTETQTCVQCHDRRDFTRKNVHAALEEGCTACHDLHDAQKLALRGAAVNERCSDCHDAAKTHAHPIGPDRKDPRTRQPLTCAGCHEPHSSDFERMLTHDQKRDLCVQCHSAGMEH
jgi:predicted CXXCH cytochrome family protein